MSLPEVEPQTSGRPAYNLITIPTKQEWLCTHFRKLRDSNVNKIANTKSELILHSYANEAKNY
jgi:hypothetical protein